MMYLFIPTFDITDSEAPSRLFPYHEATELLAVSLASRVLVSGIFTLYVNSSVLPGVSAYPVFITALNIVTLDQSVIAPACTQLAATFASIVPDGASVE